MAPQTKMQNQTFGFLRASLLAPLLLIALGCGKVDTTKATSSLQSGQNRERTQGGEMPRPSPGNPERLPEQRPPSGSNQSPQAEPSAAQPNAAQPSTPEQQTQTPPAAPAPETPREPGDGSATPVQPGAATVQPSAPETEKQEAPAPQAPRTVQPVAPNTPAQETRPQARPNATPTPKPNVTPPAQTAPARPPAAPPVATRPNVTPTPKPAAPAPPASQPVLPAQRPAAGPQLPREETPANNRQLSPNEIAESGMIRPTVYYFPEFNDDRTPCDGRVNFHGSNGEVITQVCESTLKACGLQGSCSIVKNGRSRAFNILTRVSGQDRFFEIDEDGCKFGYGVQQICLDPFYTLAADLDVYRPGDVIYVPAVAGLQLPNGRTHDGFFVVRDRGRGINGKGRFDFFSGFFSWTNATNPFTKIGLTDTGTNVPYYKVTGERAARVRALRGYPGLPPAPIAARPTNTSNASRPAGRALGR